MDQSLYIFTLLFLLVFNSVAAQTLQITEPKKNDPINILQNFLIKKGWMSHYAINTMRNLIHKQIDLSFQYANKSPFPKKKDLSKYLYKETT